MLYQEALRYLYGLINYEKIGFSYSDLKLERMQELMDRLGNPQFRVPTILIAGTKGKGSTSYLLHRFLMAYGFSCGLYSKPHLVTYRERIRINDTFIGGDELGLLVRRIRPVVEEMGRSSPLGKPTYFEVSVALAFLYFLERKVDLAVFEVGLGGRLDATNVSCPDLTAITPVGMDHMDVLGNSVGEIAKEKAGIIRSGIPLVLASQCPEAEKVILEVARLKSAPVTRFEEECFFEILSRDSLGSQLQWEVKSWGRSASLFPLLGDHQVANFLMALLILREWGLDFREHAIETALTRVSWPGRIQVISNRPLIIFDVAHNRDSFLALRNTLRNYLGIEKSTFLLGFVKGKDVNSIAEVLGGFADSIVVTQPYTPRAIMPGNLVSLFERVAPTLVVKDPAMAYTFAKDLAVKNELPLVVAGSFYLARLFEGEINRIFNISEEVELC